MTSSQSLRKAQILDAAGQCFVKYGFHGASMSKISKTGKMSVGHIYHYFDGKDAIIEGMVKREADVHREKLGELERIAPEKFIAEVVRHAQESIGRAADPFQSVLNFEILAESQRNPKIGQILRGQDLEFSNAFERILELKLGFKLDDGRRELLFSLFSGIPVRSLRNPDIDHASLSAAIAVTIPNILRSGT